MKNSMSEKLWTCDRRSQVRQWRKTKMRSANERPPTMPMTPVTLWGLLWFPSFQFNCWLHRFIMAARHSCASQRSFWFAAVVINFLSFLLLPNLWVCLADRQQTMPHVRCWPKFINVRQKLGHLSKKLAAQNIKISARIRAISRSDREYLWNEAIVTRNTALQAAIISASYTLNLVNLVTETSKNRTEFRPTKNQLFRTLISSVKWRFLVKLSC